MTGYIGSCGVWALNPGWQESHVLARKLSLGRAKKTNSFWLAVRTASVKGVCPCPAVHSDCKDALLSPRSSGSNCFSGTTGVCFSRRTQLRSEGKLTLRPPTRGLVQTLHTLVCFPYLIFPALSYVLPRFATRKLAAPYPCLSVSFTGIKTKFPAHLCTLSPALYDSVVDFNEQNFRLEK